MGALRSEIPKDEAEPRLPALVRLARPKQWIKNVLVIAAPGAAGVLGNGTALFRTAIAFVCFCLAASGTVLHQRRARRRGRSPASHEAAPPDRVGRGVRAHRGHRRRPAHRRAIALSFAARWQLSLVVGGYLVADRGVQRVAEARGRARPRVCRVGIRAPDDRGRRRGRRDDLAVVPHRRGLGLALHGHRQAPRGDGGAGRRRRRSPAHARRCTRASS